VKEKHKQVRFKLLGRLLNSPDSIRQEELDNWQESEMVEYLGGTEDVRPYIRECSVYVLPSYREGTPRSILEAMSMGRPVITTDAPGCRETVEEGVNGFLVPVKDSQALAEAMEKFIEQPERIELDLWYINNWSLWMDLKIILKTFKAFLEKSNLYKTAEDDPVRTLERQVNH